MTTMNITIQREELLRLLRTCSGVVERKSSQNPVFSNVLLELRSGRLSVSASDQEITVQAKTKTDNEGSGKILVPFRKLYEICRVLADGTPIKFACEESRLKLSAGKSRYVLATMADTDLPMPDDSAEEIKIHLKPQELANTINKVAFAMADQDVRYFLNGMLFEVLPQQLNLVAADGHRLAVTSIAVNSSGSNKFILPRKGVLELLRLTTDMKTEVTLGLAENYAKITSENLNFTTKLLNGRFPDYERVVAVQGEHEMWADREMLKASFVRATALFSDKFYALRLKFAPGKLSVLAITEEQDKVEEELDVDYNGEGLEIAFNGRYLIDVLQVITTKMVKFEFTTAASSVLVTPCDASQNQNILNSYVIMPLRV